MGSMIVSLGIAFGCLGKLSADIFETYGRHHLDSRIPWLELMFGNMKISSNFTAQNHPTGWESGRRIKAMPFTA